jgi:hypothetical protein
MQGAEGYEQCNKNELIPAPPQKDKDGSRNHYLWISQTARTHQSTAAQRTRT